MTEHYADALSDLSSTQSALLFSTQGLSKAQIAETLIVKEGNAERAYEAMLNAGLLKSKGSLATAELEETVATIANTDAKKAEILAKITDTTTTSAEGVATTVVTKAKLKEAVQTGLLTEAEAKLIAAKTGVTIASKKEALALKSNVLTGFTNGVKAAAIEVKALASDLAMLALAHPVITGLTAALTAGAVAFGIHKKKQKENAKALKEIANKAEEARAAIKSLNEEFQSNSKTVNDLKNRYAKLAQGVNQFTGENKSLSTEDYNEFLDLNKQLLDIFPDLTHHYNSNGDAIADLSGNVDSIVGSLDDLIAKQRELANIEIAEKLPDTFKGVKQQSEEYKKEIDNLKDKLKDPNLSYKKLSGITKNDFYDYVMGYALDKKSGAHDQTIIENVIRSVEELKKKGVDFKLDDDESIKKQTDAMYDELVNTYKGKISDLQNEISVINEKNKANWQGLSNDLLAWVITEPDYTMVSDEARSAIEKIINSIDYGSLNFEKIGDLKDFISKNVLEAFNGVDGDKISELFNQLFSGENLSAETLNDIYSQLYNYFKDNPVVIQFVADMADARTSENKTLAESLVDGKLFGDTDQDRANQINYGTNDVRDKYLQQLESWLDEINDSDRYDILMGVRIPDEVLYGTQEEFIEWYNSLKNEVDNSPITIEAYLANDRELQDRLIDLNKAGKLDEEALKSFADYDEMLKLCDNDASKLLESIKNIAKQKFSNPLNTANDLRDINSGLDSLDVVYDRAMIDGFVDSDAITGLYDQFGDLDILDDFIYEMQNIGREGQNLQEIFNDLATAYIDSKVSLGELSEATKDQTIQELKLLGVTNAEEAVTSRLAWQNKVASEAINELQQAKVDTKITTQELAEATVDEIEKLIDATVAAGGDAQNLRLLKLEKQGVNEVSIQAIDDINELYQLAIVAGLSATNLEGLKMIMSGQANGPTKEGIIRDTKQAISDLFKGIELPKYRYEGNSDKDNSKANEKNKGSDKKEKEKIDWIERRLDKLQKKTDRLFDSAEKSTTNMTSYYKKAGSSLKDLMNNDSRAYDRYMAEANKTGLSSKYQKKVQDGTIDIQSIKNEKLRNKISEYQQWYEKAQSAADNYRESVEKLYNIPLDKAAKKVEKYSDSIDLLEKKLDNSTVTKKDKYNSKNKLVNKETRLKKKTYEAYQKADEEADANLSDAKKAAKDLGIKIKNGKEVDESKFKIGSEKWQAAIAYNEALRDSIKSQKELDDAEQDWISWSVEAEKIKFDNITDGYEKTIKLSSESISAAQRQVEQLEAKGKKVTKSLYTDQIKTNNKNLKLLNQQLVKQEEQLANIEKGTDEWYAAKEAVEATKDEISKTTVEVSKLKEAYTQLHFERLNDVKEQIGRIATEYEFLASLMEHEKNVDEDTTGFTQAGLTKMGVASIGLNTFKKQVALDKKEIVDLNEMLSKGIWEQGDYKFESINQLRDKIDELYTTWQEDEKSLYEYQTKIVDAMKEKYQAELTLAQKLVDKKKEALQQEKSLHDYQRQLSEQVNDINTIQKQIAAYQGDSSQEGMAKLQSLQKSLLEAQDKLEETEYDKYISDQEEMLSNLITEYEETITKKMDDFYSLLESGLKIVDSSGTDIGDTLSAIAKAYGYDPETKTILKALSEGKSVEEGVDKGSEEKVETVNSEYDDKKNNPTPQPESNASPFDDLSGKPVEDKPQSVKDKAIEYLNKHLTKTDKKASDIKADLNKALYNQYGSKVLNGEEIKALAKIVGVTDNDSSSNGALYKKLAELGVITPNKKDQALDYIMKHLTKTSKKESEIKLDINKVFYKNWGGKVLSLKEMDELAKILNVSFDGKDASKNSPLYKTLKMMQFTGFKRGGIARLVKSKGEDGIAMVRNGEGFIRPEDVGNIQDLLKVVPIMTDLSAKMPLSNFDKVKTTQTANISDVEFNFELPNVTNSESLIKEIQNNKHVQRTIQGVLLNPLTGKSMYNVKNIK